ncbi:MAG: hypothetical protein ABR574_04450 [Cryomorphaceae bacterium]|nr:hypothetical protein [Flavobacteriales bacterium]
MRVKKEAVPENAVRWIDESLESLPNIHWYLEKTSGVQSYEAKFTKSDRRYSVEFSEDGSIEDIEYIARWKDLPKEVMNKLDSYFQNEYDRVKIHKIQVQYTGADSTLSRALRKDDILSLTRRYEIEYYGKKNREKVFWEGLFDERGGLIEKREIIQRPVDNLNY